MLLTHTSSLEEEDDARSSATYAYGTDAKDRLEEYVRESFAPGGSRHWQGQWRTGKPGTERIYSGDAFDLLAVAVARATGESFDRYVDRAIVKPLGMVSTSYWLAGCPSRPLRRLPTSTWLSTSGRSR